MSGMEVRKGIPVSPGVVARYAYVLDTEEIHIPQRFIEKNQVEEEAARYEEGNQMARRSLEQEIERMGDKIPITSQILEIHKSLVADPVLKNEILAGIRENQYTAEHAVSRTIQRYIKKFEKMDSPIISERVHDLVDIEKLLLKILLGHRFESMHALDQEVVVVAHNLTPAQAAKLDPRWVKGFATEVGGKTSHTAIMARALGIPAVVGLEGISTSVMSGDLVVIDGFRGTVILNPDEDTIEEAHLKEANVRRFSQRLRRDARLPAETIDGYPLELHANVEMPQEVASAVELGASGIGLFRTEYLYLQKPRGGEDWHYQHYLKLVEALDGRPVTIRTLDLGGDKGLSEDGGALREENPFLGCRSIRYCFAHPEMFREQLRAILRVSAIGRVAIMLPMVTSLAEIERASRILDEVKQELRRKGLAFDEAIPLGVMVEVPSLAIVADQVARRVSFFSVGTNDLVQYTLAVDRGNEHVASLYDPVHPAVIRLLARTLEAGTQAGIQVSICGEMASEPLYIPFLIGLGYRSLSVSPPMLPEVKRIVRSIQVHEVRRLAQSCLDMTDGQEISAQLRQWAQDHVRHALYHG